VTSRARRDLAADLVRRLPVQSQDQIVVAGQPRRSYGRGCRGQPEVAEDPLEHTGVGEEGQDDHRRQTPGAAPRVDVEDPAEQRGPGSMFWWGWPRQRPLENLGRQLGSLLFLVGRPLCGVRPGALSFRHGPVARGAAGAASGGGSGRRTRRGRGPCFCGVRGSARPGGAGSRRGRGPARCVRSGWARAWRARGRPGHRRAARPAPGRPASAVRSTRAAEAPRGRPRRRCGRHGARPLRRGERSDIHRPPRTSRFCGKMPPAWSR